MKRRIYPKHKHLLGKYVTYNGETCFVAGIDTRKGITIDFLNKESPNTFNHLFCLFNPKYDYDNFHKVFCEITEQIEKGIIENVSGGVMFGTVDHCAFK